MISMSLSVLLFSILFLHGHVETAQAKLTLFDNSQYLRGSSPKKPATVTATTTETETTAKSNSNRS